MDEAAGPECIGQAENTTAFVILNVQKGEVLYEIIHRK